VGCAAGVVATVRQKPCLAERQPVCVPPAGPRMHAFMTSFTDGRDSGAWRQLVGALVAWGSSMRGMPACCGRRAGRHMSGS
jgi:hypothetical protein